MVSGPGSAAQRFSDALLIRASHANRKLGPEALRRIATRCTASGMREEVVMSSIDEIKTIRAAEHRGADDIGHALAGR